nr:hypothetical protein [Tanacetum cinerariifolium]
MTVTDKKGGKKKKDPLAGLTILLLKKMNKFTLLLNLKWKMMNTISKERLTPATQDATTRPSAQPQDDTSTNVVPDTSYLVDSTSKADTEILYVEEEQGEEELIEEDQVGPNPGKVIWLRLDQTLNPCKKTLLLQSTTATTTTLPPPPLQSSTDPELATCVSALEKRKNHDLYSKIDKQVNEVIKEAVHNALQALICERFRDLSKLKMKEISHDWIFESGSYKSHPDHSSLYQALEVSMEHENREGFIEALATSLQKSSAWTTFDSRKAPSSFSKQKHASPSEQPVNEEPILEYVHLSESEDIDATHLLKIKARPDWLKPVPEETLETPKLDWIIPLYDLPKTENNWADVLDKTYKDPKENKLLHKTRDIASFIKCAVRADYKEYKISEADFKNMHPNDIEDMYLLHLQGKLNHLPRANNVYLFNAVYLWIRNIVIRQYVKDLQLGIKSYQMMFNLTQPRWDATNFLFKEDYTIIHKPRAVIYRYRYNQKKMMQKTEVHKFSDGTLTRILEKLDYMVKDYELFKFNPGMENRIWTEDDKQRSQEFIKLIEHRVKIRRIFSCLKSFVLEG